MYIIQLLVHSNKSNDYLVFQIYILYTSTGYYVVITYYLQIIGKYMYFFLIHSL